MDDARYMTLIWLPHANAKYRKLKVSHRLVIAVALLIGSTLALTTMMSALFLSQVHESAEVDGVSARDLERELSEANSQLVRSVKRVEAVSRYLLEEQRQREQQLADARKEYESLKVLTAGQEKIAEAHRAILERRSIAQRVLEVLVAFLVGVVSSLVASVVWYSRHAEPVTSDEVRKLDLR